MIGILLINLGTPDSASEHHVHAYLNEFLSDPYVITLPTPLRNFLVQKIILRKRPKKSAHAYQKIWTKQGSPLLVNSLALKDNLMSRVSVSVSLGMRYGNPSIESAIAELQAKQCEKIIVLPLFPQFARATTQSALDRVTAILQEKKYHPELTIIRDFHDHDFYIDSLSKKIKESYEKYPDHFLLLSYHSLPARHQDATSYREQCFKTSHLITQKLNLSQHQFQISFQSRLGFTKWITPYTDHVVKALRKQGIKKLSVVCPSFVADCIETLEEIDIRLRDQWMRLGGESFHCIPCLNADDEWVAQFEYYLKNTVF